MWVSKLSSQQDEKHCAGAGVRLGGWIVFSFYGEVAEMRYTVYYTVEPVKGYLTVSNVSFKRLHKH
jgi:hypothetical protein